MHLLRQAWLLKPLQAMRRACSQEPLVLEGGAPGRKQSHQMKKRKQDMYGTCYAVLLHKNWLIHMVICGVG